MMSHEPLEKGETIHAGHLDIESKNVGFQRKDLVSSDVGITRRPHHLDVGLTSDRFAENSSNDSGIVDNKNFDLAAHG